MTPDAMSGTVASFDAARGLGEVTSLSGAVYPFHCVEIADGTRTIDVGAVVRFELRARLGRWEAAGLSSIGR